MEAWWTLEGVTPRTIKPRSGPTNIAAPPIIRLSIFMVRFRFNFFAFAHKNRRLAAWDERPGHDLPDQRGKGNAPEEHLWGFSPCQRTRRPNDGNFNQPEAA